MSSRKMEEIIEMEETDESSDPLISQRVWTELDELSKRLQDDGLPPEASADDRQRHLWRLLVRTEAQLRSADQNLQELHTEENYLNNMLKEYVKHAQEQSQRTAEYKTENQELRLRLQQIKQKQESQSKKLAEMLAQGKLEDIALSSLSEQDDDELEITTQIIETELKKMGRRKNFVLVGKEDMLEQQLVLIRKLEEKKFQIEKDKIKGHMLYGLQGPIKIFESFFHGESSKNVESALIKAREKFKSMILETKINTKNDEDGAEETLEGLEDLMARGVFEAKFGLYEAKVDTEDQKKDSSDTEEEHGLGLSQESLDVHHVKPVNEDVQRNNTDLRFKSVDFKPCVSGSNVKATHVMPFSQRRMYPPVSPFSCDEGWRKKRNSAMRSLKKMSEWNDYVIVGEKDKKFQQEDFIKALEEQEKFDVEIIETKDRIFYGLRATDKAVGDSLSKTCEGQDVKTINRETRIRMVKSILKETKMKDGLGDTQGLDDLLMAGVFESKHCSHKSELEKKKKSTERFLEEMALWNDWVLVGKEDKQDQQEPFIKKLEEECIKVVSTERNGNIFYGLQPPEDFQPIDSMWSDEEMKKSFTIANRIGYLSLILQKITINTDNVGNNKEEGLNDLIKNGVFETLFCSHEKLLMAYDFLLMGKMDKKDRQEEFIVKLQDKKLDVDVIMIKDNIFYGLRVKDELIMDHLQDGGTYNMAFRIRSVKSILNETKLNTEDTENNTEPSITEGLEELIENHVFEKKFCLHEALLTEYYYILVGKEDKKKEQEVFIEELKEKKIEVKEIKNNGSIFYGLRATDKVFEDYCDLLKVSNNCNSEDVKMSITLATRIRIVDYIVNQTRIDAEYTKEETGGLSSFCAGRQKIDGLEDLLTKGVFETKFCLHEEHGKKELKEWAQWKATFNHQPFKKIRDYFGEKVALYYLWLGWYTTLLIPAALLGVLVFLSGIAFFNDNPIIQEVCESNITMCPRCDKRCNLWQLSDTCSYAKVSYLFDNKATVVFAVIMAIWATTFLELWKRYRTKHVSEWKVYDWCEEEEELVLEIVNDSGCKPKFFHHYALQKSLLLVMGTVFMLFIYLKPHGLVLFRAMARANLSKSQWKFVRDHYNTMAVILGSVVHFIIMQLMTLFNKTLLKRLYKRVYPNSRAEREKGFQLMMFTIQFFTLFSSLFYVAFLLGRSNGYPGNYARTAGHRLDECHPSGCLTDLFIQMLVIMTLKQVFSNISEITKPRLLKRWRRINTAKRQSAADSRKKLIVSCIEFIFPFLEKRWRKTDTTDSRTDRDKHRQCWIEKCDECLLNDWQKDYQLADSDDLSLFYVMLKMVIQFSLTTLFVAAFPLAPFLALINNIFEIRLDAIKMVRFQRRLISKKTNNMGIWTTVLETIGVLAVIANSLLIGITSDFIPRLVYRYGYGPCASGGNSTHCMSGYINSTLTTAYMNAYNPDEFVLPRERHLYSVIPCSFRAYRSDEDHSLTAHFWWVLAARFAFVFIFEQSVLLWKFILAWLIPNDHLAVKNERLENKLDRLKEDLKERRRTKFKLMQNRFY